MRDEMSEINREQRVYYGALLEVEPFVFEEIYQCESINEGSGENTVLPIAHCMRSLNIEQFVSEIDPSYPYRRHLTYDELLFAWNAVIVFILIIISVMIFVTIILFCLYG
jgi:hypothetical protein